DIGGRNVVAGQMLNVQNEDVEFGNVDLDATPVQLTPGPSTPGTLRGVRVTGQRTADSGSGQVNLLLGRILGRTTFGPSFQSSSVNLDRDICLVVDRSGSMYNLDTAEETPAGWAPCDPPHPSLSRWAGASAAVTVFANELLDTTPLEKLALVTYSSETIACGISYTESDINVPLTTDVSGAVSAMAALSAGPINGMTNITAGVQNGISVLTDTNYCRPFAKRTMIVLTDGLHNQGDPPIMLAANAVANNIVIHTITFSATADQAGMQQLAEATYGKHFHAPDSAALQVVFQQIARTLPVLMVE
ncbi:MAG TPA: vWA domain-containing protein, partial [Pirellulaceae bacterium]